MSQSDWNRAKKNDKCITLSYDENEHFFRKWNQNTHSVRHLLPIGCTPTHRHSHTHNSTNTFISILFVERTVFVVDIFDLVSLSVSPTPAICYFPWFVCGLNQQSQKMTTTTTTPTSAYEKWKQNRLKCAWCCAVWAVRYHCMFTKYTHPYTAETNTHPNSLMTAVTNSIQTV